ncbi:MAG: PHP domain-containing protein [Candidatus Aminicenantes bacterium]|nr:PHP domain-containing protein [Candidatus Aminicenantes bacterium]
MDLLTDLHIHTLVSDGENTTPEILDAAARLGLRRISITDHDAVGAYRHFIGNPFDAARRLGVELVPGIELDTDYGGVEVHLLGYGIDLNHPELNAHLTHIQTQRRQRIRLQAQAINNHFHKQVVDLDAIFLSERDTVMKPHLFRFLVRAGLVEDYKAFKHLLEQHARVDVKMKRPQLHEAINLILRAGGKPVLAHPGYLKKNNLDVHALVKSMSEYGLAGLETDYPYWQPRNPGCSRFPNLESEQRMVEYVRNLASRFNLETTRGSDSHDLDTLEWFNRHRSLH